MMEDDQLITDRELAAWLQISLVKLRRDRQRGGGPPFQRYDRAVRYRVADVRAWVDSITVHAGQTNNR